MEVIKRIFHAAIKWVFSIAALLVGGAFVLLAVLWPVIYVVLGIWIYNTFFG